MFPKNLPLRLKMLMILGRWIRLSSDFGTMNNLQTSNDDIEELKISLAKFDDFKDEYLTLKFSTSLTTYM